MLAVQFRINCTTFDQSQLSYFVDCAINRQMLTGVYTECSTTYFLKKKEIHKSYRMCSIVLDSIKV